MPITVRFPNGQAVLYNDAHWIVWLGERGAALYTAQDGHILARVMGDAIVEFVRPCSVSNPLISPAESIDICIEHIRSFPEPKLAQLKRLLQKFNRKTCRWKE
jgi:hypothetical protein